MKKGVKIIIPVIAVVLALAIAATLLLTSRYMYGGPVFSLLLAAKKTVKAHSLTVTFEGETAFEMQFASDKSKKAQTYLFNYDYGTLVFENETEYYLRKDNTYGYVDRLSGIAKKRINVHNAIINGEKISIDEALEAFCYLKVEENKEAARAFLKELYFNGISDKEWLEEYLEFSKEGSTYNFVLGIDFVEEVLRMATDTALITEKSADEALKLIKKLDNFVIKLSATVEGGIIKIINLSFNEINIKITLSEYNTASLDREYIDGIISKAKELD